jgi:hypothetical protein
MTLLSNFLMLFILAAPLIAEADEGYSTIEVSNLKPKDLPEGSIFDFPDLGTIDPKKSACLEKSFASPYDCQLCVKKEVQGSAHIVGERVVESVDVDVNEMKIGLRRTNDEDAYLICQNQSFGTLGDFVKAFQISKISLLLPRVVARSSRAKRLERLKSAIKPKTEKKKP